MPVSGIFGNAMAYLRLGDGPKTLLWLPGGPGNVLPSGGMSLRMGQSWSRPFVDAGYTVWWVTRRRNIGRTGQAMALLVKDMYPRLPRPARYALGELMGRSMYGKTHPYFANDVMVEAEAEAACDSREVLPAIPVPVLLVCGDRDPYFPKEMYQETARLIPDCTLRMYEGRGHNVVSDRRLARDILDFVAAGSGHMTLDPGAALRLSGDS